MENLDKVVEAIQNEQFCQAFEMEILSAIINQNALERWVPGFSPKHTEIEHIGRYLWVSQFVHEKRVLDIACGAGRGSFVMAEEGKAKEILACDIDPKVVKYASVRNKHERINFAVQNAETFFVKDLFDVIVSFETIEHIPNVESFLERMKASLSDSGYFFVSTPISRKTLDEKPHNEHHIREWGFLEFHKIVSKYFQIENIYLQMHPPSISKLKRLFKILKKKLLSVNYNSNNSTYNDILKPIPWAPETFPVKKLLSGYQILQCKPAR